LEDNNHSVLNCLRKPIFKTSDDSQTPLFDVVYV
jgi:hypothetical protein